MGRQRTCSRIVASALGVVLALFVASAASAGATRHDPRRPRSVTRRPTCGDRRTQWHRRDAWWSLGRGLFGQRHRLQSPDAPMERHALAARSKPEPSGRRAHSVAATSPTNVWAVGSSGAYPAPSRTLILHWSGKKWQRMPSIAGSLSAVTATSPTNALAVGATDQGDALILHWNGKKWQQMASPAGMLSGVAATSATNAWAVGGTTNGETLILHWNGKSWQQTSSPSVGGDEGLASFLLGVAAPPGRPVWAVGDGGNCGCGPGDPLVERWNGSTWSQDSTSELQGGIDSLPWRLSRRAGGGRSDRAARATARRTASSWSGTAPPGYMSPFQVSKLTSGASPAWRRYLVLTPGPLDGRVRSGSLALALARDPVTTGPPRS